MILQKCMHIGSNKCDVSEMYFNGKGYSDSLNSICIEKNGIISTDTYFNSISIEKWKKYTVAEKFCLEIDIEGKCDIYLCFAWIDENNIIRRFGDNKVFYTKKTSGRETLIFEYPKCEKAVIAYYQICAVEKVQVFNSAYVSNHDVTARDIKLAVSICTYKREEYVYENVKRLIEECIPYANIDILISDNSCSLDAKKLKHGATDRVFVYRNKNLGGSGGFARCIIEAKKSEKYTHVLLMDDDVLINSDSIIRTYTFLRLLKNDYLNSMIGGGMLIMDKKNIQFESGAFYYRGDLSFTQKNADLRTIRNVIQNELKRQINYNAWCFCSIPLSLISYDNLPLPIFVHMDDVEYGVRNNAEIITMNGISLWHPFYSNQRSESIVYYDVRNKLILMSEFGGVDIRDYARKYLDIFHLSIFNYDYERTLMACKGIEDFCKGIDYFKKIDAVDLNERLIKKNKKWILMQGECDEKRDSPSKRTISRRLLLKTYFLPNFNKRVSVYDCSISEVFPEGEKQFYLYNPVTHKITSYKKSLFMMLKAKKACRRTKKMIDHSLLDVSFEWKDRINELYSIDFWNEYLRMENSVNE